jgi:hypothetical protein
MPVSKMPTDRGAKLFCHRAEQHRHRRPEAMLGRFVDQHRRGVPSSLSCDPLGAT